jgi:hypothetical protein
MAVVDQVSAEDAADGESKVSSAMAQTLVCDFMPPITD